MNNKELWKTRKEYAAKLRNTEGSKKEASPKAQPSDRPNGDNKRG